MCVTEGLTGPVETLVSDLTQGDGPAINELSDIPLSFRIYSEQLLKL